jgi:hypothetical protein
MSARIRFADAADVFAAFPRLEAMAARPAGATDPLAHARHLIASPRPAGALAFIAHLLPRREAIWWGRQCVEAILGRAAQDEAMELATQWVREPSEPLRRRALSLWRDSETRTPTHWLARAVAYSGGSLLAPDQPASPPAPDDCALAVNAAVVLSATRTAPTLILPWIRACAESGVVFAAGGEAQARMPKDPPVTAAARPAGDV